MVEGELQELIDRALQLVSGRVREELADVPATSRDDLLARRADTPAAAHAAAAGGAFGFLLLLFPGAAPGLALDGVLAGLGSVVGGLCVRLGGLQAGVVGCVQEEQCVPDLRARERSEGRGVGEGWLT